MARCPNCSAEVGCGCNLKTASDGQKTCGACHYDYTQLLFAKQQVQVQVEQPPIVDNKPYVVAPVINSITPIYNNFNNP